jgi:hypothetical protein
MHIECPRGEELTYVVVENEEVFWRTLWSTLHRSPQHTGTRRPEAATRQLPHAEQWRDGGVGYDIRPIESIVCV